MKQLLVTICVLALASAALAQPPEQVWARNYGGGGNDYGYTLIEAPNGDIVMSGDSWRGNQIRWDYTLIRVDPENGNPLDGWPRYYGGANDEEYPTVVNTADGGYAFAGLTNWTVNFEIPQARVDAMILRTDSEGNLHWSRFYGGNHHDVFINLVELHNGAFAIVGNTWSYGAGAVDGWLMITDDQGDSLWSVALGGGGFDQLRDIYEAGVDPWVRRQSFLAGETVEDSRLQGVVFIDDRYYVSGGGNDNNMIYVLDMNGNPVSSFPQFGGSRNGMKDLAWDGELIWGVAEETVYGFNTNGDLITSFQVPFDRLAAITWDPERELLWISESTSYIHGYDREGNHDLQDELSRQELRIYGLAYWQDDPDGYLLYIFHNPGGDGPSQVIQKMNLDNGDTMFVSVVEPEDGGTPVGAFIKDQYDTYGSWVFMDIANSGDGDWIDVWQLQPSTGWMEVEPSEGVMNAGVARAGSDTGRHRSEPNHL